MDTNILLESGTNELEILEFTIGNNSYGINVAKVKEILPFTKITPVPNSNPSIEGIFVPRDVIITAIDLAKALKVSVEKSQEDMLVITNFNQLNIAFHVQKVLGIHRISWADIVKPDDTINGNGTAIATGIIRKDKKLIVILDFERIVEDICPETSLKVSEIDKLSDRGRNNTHILIAEDSALLMKLITESLQKAGYTNVHCANNGKEAYDYLERLREENDDDKRVKCLITDIEMPVMDGHRLIKLVREHQYYNELPIIIFSSLINDDMKRKGESLGANMQISKPEIGQLVGIIDSLVGFEK